VSGREHGLDGRVAHGELVAVLDERDIVGVGDAAVGGGGREERLDAFVGARLRSPEMWSACTCVSKAYVSSTPSSSASAR